MKTYTTTTEQPTAHSRAHHRPVLEFVAVWMLAAVCAILGVVIGGVALSLDPTTHLARLGQTALGIVALLFLAAAVSCVVYARLEHGVAYGRREQPTPDTGPFVTHMRRNIDIAGETHQNGDRAVNWGRAKPKDITAALNFMKRTGETSRSKVMKGAGVTQTVYEDIMTALDDIGYVRKKGPRESADIVGDLSAALDDFMARVKW